MEKLSVPVASNFELVEQINEEFGKYRCRVMALGKNRNGSYFSKEAVNEAIPTIKNIPIIGFIYEDENGVHMKGHEHDVVRENGELVYKSKCVPYGVVPADSNFTYEDVTEEDGSIATYLCCDAIIWEGRFPEVVDAMNNSEAKFGQSMEIAVKKAKKYSEDKRYIDVQKFSVSALCLLGKDDENVEYNVEPCFPSCALLSYAEDNQFIELMDEFKSALKDCFSNINKEEGGADMEIENTIVEPITEEVFETAEPIVEEAKEEEIIPEFETTTEETVAETVPVESEFVSQAKQAFALASAKRHAIGSVINSSAYYGEEKCVEYWMVDYDDNYVYCVVYTYDKEGMTEGYARAAYIYNEQEDKAYLTGDFEKMYVDWLTQEEHDSVIASRNAFEVYKAEHSYSNAEYDELAEFKANRLAEDHKNEVESVLAQFGDLEGTEEFELLKQNALNIDKIEVLEDKCYALRGRMVKTENNKTDEHKTVIVKKQTNFESADSNELYGGLFAKYGL